jgi:hypothetical protein
MLGARFRTSGREEKGGNTLCVLVAGEEIDEDLGTWRRAAAAVAPVWGEREARGSKVAACGGRRDENGSIRICFRISVRFGFE